MAGNFIVFIIYFKLASFELILLIKSKLKLKALKNSNVNAQKWKFFRKLFDAKRWMDGKLINVADQIRAWRTDFFLQNK